MPKTKSATKKRSTQSIKVDRYLLSTQPHEILRVRLMFYDTLHGEGTHIIHPSIEFISKLIKKYGNSRRVIYRELLAIGFKKVPKH